MNCLNNVSESHLMFKYNHLMFKYNGIYQNFPAIQVCDIIRVFLAHLRKYHKVIIFGESGDLYKYIHQSQRAPDRCA